MNRSTRKEPSQLRPRTRKTSPAPTKQPRQVDSREEPPKAESAEDRAALNLALGVVIAVAGLFAGYILPLL